MAVYAALVGGHFHPVAAGADPAGYLLSARLLSEGQLTTEMRVLPGFPPAEAWEYTPLGAVHSERLGALVPTYPVGLPLAYAVSARVFGWHWGPVLIGTLFACGAVAATYLASRESGAGRAMAAAAAVALAVCPLLLHASFQPLSDPAAACTTALAVAFALRARRQQDWIGSVAAGAALAGAVLLRPTNLLALPAIALALGRPRLLAGALLGGLPGAVFLGWYQHTLYGGVMETGYGPIWALFDVAHVAPALHKYGVWLPAFLPVGALALVLAPWLPWRSRAREVAVLLLWFFAFAGFYAFYRHTHEIRWFLRFLLPGLPALLALAALAADSLCGRLAASRRRFARRTAAVIAILVSLGTGIHHWRAEDLGGVGRKLEMFRDAAIWTDAHLPPDAVILTLYASGSFYVYTERTVLRADVIKARRFADLTALAAENRWPVYALLAREADEPGLAERLPGTWSEVRRFGEAGELGLWTLDTPR